MTHQEFLIPEHSQRNAPLERLGYIDAARRALGYRADAGDVDRRAIEGFSRRNLERLGFLDVELQGRTLCSHGKAGAVPLVSATGADLAMTLVVQPMSPWSVLSHVVERTSLRDWLSTRDDWTIRSQLLDLDLWYFAAPFVAQAKQVLKRPGRAFEWNSRIGRTPAGAVDWTDYAVRRAPYGRLEYRLREPTVTLDAAPHRVMKWVLAAVVDSVRDWSSVPCELKQNLIILRQLLAGFGSLRPTKDVLGRLPRTGSWTGYSGVYREVANLAALSGVLSPNDAVRCAFAVDAKSLFEVLVVQVASEWAALNGFAVLRDQDDSSRVPILPMGERDKVMLESLRPDVVLLSEHTAIVIDAKYKRHYDDLSGPPASVRLNEWYDEYRHDVHQILSYGVTYRRERTILLLTHPALRDTHQSPDGGLQLWRLGGATGVFVGLLPMCMHDAKTLNDVSEPYGRGLTSSLAAARRRS